MEPSFCQGSMEIKQLETIAGLTETDKAALLSMIAESLSAEKALHHLQSPTCELPLPSRLEYRDLALRPRIESLVIYGDSFDNPDLIPSILSRTVRVSFEARSVRGVIDPIKQMLHTVLQSSIRELHITCFSRAQRAPAVALPQSGYRLAIIFRPL